MKILLKFILIFLFAHIPFVSSGEEFIVFGPSNFSDSTTSVIWMEQSPQGIIVVTREENEKELSHPELFGIPSHTVQVEAPSIAITWIISEKMVNSIDRGLFGPVIFDVVGRSAGLGQEVVAFDFNVNEGWVSTIGFGDLNIKHYPWIFRPWLGWLYCLPSEIIEKRNAWWFWSEDMGWFWSQRELFPLVWMADVEDWRMLFPGLLSSL